MRSQANMSKWLYSCIKSITKVICLTSSRCRAQKFKTKTRKTMEVRPAIMPAVLATATVDQLLRILTHRNPSAITLWNFLKCALLWLRNWLVSCQTQSINSRNRIMSSCPIDNLLSACFTSFLGIFYCIVNSCNSQIGATPRHTEFTFFFAVKILVEFFFRVCSFHRSNYSN